MKNQAWLPWITAGIVLLIVYGFTSQIGVKAEPLQKKGYVGECRYQPVLLDISDLTKSVPNLNPKPRGSLTPDQLRLIELAYNAGAPYDLSYAMVGILLQETQAGKLGRIGDIDQPLGLKSYGVMQIKLATAERVLKQFPEIKAPKTEEELIGKLIYDDRFTMKIAVGYLRMLQDKGLSWRETLAAYNLGYSGMRNLKHPEDFPYVRKVVKHLQKVKDLTLLSRND